MRMISSLFFLGEDGSALARINLTEETKIHDLYSFWGQPLHFPVGSEGSLRVATRGVSDFQKSDVCNSGKSTRTRISAATIAILEGERAHFNKNVEHQKSTTGSSFFFSTFIRRENILVVATMHDEVLSPAVISLLDHVVDVISVFLQGFTEEVLRENFSTVHQLLHEMLDFGYPLLRYHHELASVVPKPTLEQKVRQLFDASTPQSEGVLSDSGSNDGAAGSRMTLEGGALCTTSRSRKGGETLLPLAAGRDNDTPVPLVPWRSAKSISHNFYPNSEILFDVVESIDCMMDNDGNVVYSAIRGAIEVNARLSGAESEVLIRVDHPEAMLDVGLHYSVRAGLYESQRVFSFIPPEGKFTLCHYTAVPAVSRFGTTKRSPFHASLIPFYVTPRSFLLLRQDKLTSEASGKSRCSEPAHFGTLTHQEGEEEWNREGGYLSQSGDDLEKDEEGRARNSFSPPRFHISKEGNFSCLVGWRGGGAPLRGPNNVRNVVIRLRFSRRVSSIQVESCNSGRHRTVLSLNELHWYIDRLESTAPYIRGVFTLPDEPEENLGEVSDPVEEWKGVKHNMEEERDRNTMSNATTVERFIIPPNTPLPARPDTAEDRGEVPTTPPVSSPNFVGMHSQVITASSRPSLPIGISAQIEFSIMNYSLSNVTIGSVQIGERGREKGLSFSTGGTSVTKLFKGVKYTTKAGNFLVRSTS